MDHSLINPNQCRVYGVAICDDPFDPYRALGIHDPETDTKIPLQVQGSFTFLKTRSPSLEEIQDCKTIIMTSETEWEPATVELLPRSEAAREIEAIRTEVRVERVRVDAQPSEPQVLVGSSESDAVLAAVSSALSSVTFLPRMVSAIQVNSDPSGVVLPPAHAGGQEDTQGQRVAAAAKSDVRHSSVTAEELSRKWRIGLYTAKETLKVTTQFGIRHAVHPLRRRYRTDIMQMRLRRLNTTFYTD
jgi:hypothetical protein